MVSNKEIELVVLVVLGIAVVGIFRAFKWLTTGPRTPDPWDATVEDAVEREDAVPLCSHCLTPQQHNGWFCPECGATVGPYCNYLPLVYPFSLGECVRAGTAGLVRRNWLTMTGYLLLAFCFLPFLLAAFYLLLFFDNLRRTASQSVAQPS